MKRIHSKKLLAIMEVKGKALFSKNFIIMPLFSIGFTFVMKLVYDAMASGNGASTDTYLLALGVVMNICMTGVYCVAATLAEEKEKHTLRTLMTSSVNGLEFFLGSLLPVTMMMIAVNIVLVPIASVHMGAAAWLIYLLITTLASITGGIIGMIFGIYAKNQVSAGTITTPALLIFMMIPMFSAIHPVLAKISGFLFTGVIMDVVDGIAAGSTNIEINSIIIVTAEIFLSAILFLLLYKKNGFEAN